jgi:plasmid stabilization system protein ParE
MNLRFEISKLAKSEMNRVLRKLRELSENAAFTLAQEMQDCLLLIRSQPKVGRDRSQWGPGLRSRVVDQYLFIYRFNDELLEVIRFVHGSRNLDSMFRKSAGS